MVSQRFLVWGSLVCGLAVHVARPSESLSRILDYGRSPYSDSGFQRVWLKQNLDFEGWNSQAHRAFPGSFESRNLSRDNLSWEVGRRRRAARAAAHAEPRGRCGCACYGAGPAACAGRASWLGVRAQMQEVWHSNPRLGGLRVSQFQVSGGQAPGSQGPPASRPPRRAFHPDKTNNNTKHNICG